FKCIIGGFPDVFLFRANIAIARMVWGVKREVDEPGFGLCGLVYNEINRRIGKQVCAVFTLPVDGFGVVVEIFFTGIYMAEVIRVTWCYPKVFVKSSFSRT